MTRTIATIIIAVALLTIVPLLPAQQAQFPPLPQVPPSSPKAADSAKPAAFYRLEFTIHEMEGEKSLNTSNYILLLQMGHSAKMTAGSQVPYPASSSSMNYRSVGVSISCSLQETDGNPWLSLNIDISGLAPPEKAGDQYPPIFRSTNISAEAMLALGKATMVGSVDDPATKHRLQVDVTATKLK
ncbi:MAG TPA: hypothetical protein VMG30_19175 [Acidobacteriota bacterium]|nr:hypothetical protein [Acidobacteriota bacterium]